MAQGGLEAPPPTLARVIAAIATPPGQGAIGLLRLSGPSCLSVASSFVAWPGPLEPRRATLAEARAGGERVDRVLVTYFPGPRSYTGEDLVEISAHGSPYILGRLLEEALARGARLAEPGEFTRRAFQNGRLDLAQAEAVGALIRARSEAAHRSALAQLEGRLSREVEDLRREVLGVLASLEASLDHPEEDLPLLDPGETRARLSSLKDRINALARTHARGRLICEGGRVALVGLPNAGKSSLLNAILGRERAIVSATPGTTRDTVEAEAELGGLPVVLVDTAGLKDAASDPLEREGMERTRRALSSCDLAVFVKDRSRPADGEDERLIAEVEDRLGGRPGILTLTKSDLPRPNAPPDRPRDGRAPPSTPFRWPVVEVSSVTGDGVPELARLIARLLNGGSVAERAVPGGLVWAEAGGGSVVTSVRQRAALEEASAALESALPSLGSQELAALHLREALGSLAEITGASAPEEVLREVFSKFCIGK